MKKTDSKLKTRTLAQTRPYESMETARIDADQYLRFPDVFARKAPVPAQWGIKAVVKQASVTKGNPPEVKHQLVLTLEVSGPEAKIIAWDQECSDTFIVRRGGDHLSKTMGEMYMRRKKNG